MTPSSVDDRSRGDVVSEGQRREPEAKLAYLGDVRAGQSTDRYPCRQSSEVRDPRDVGPPNATRRLLLTAGGQRHPFGLSHILARSGADKGYVVARFVADVRVAGRHAHVRAEGPREVRSTVGPQRHAGYHVRQRKRKLEWNRVFGWMKTVERPAQG